MQPFVKTNMIFLTVAGSHMYGTSTPESDFDKRGVCIPPRDIVLGITQNFEQQNLPDEEDTVIYSLRKFMKLAADGNPNILEMLFAPKGAVLFTKPAWDELIAHKGEFLTARAYPRFTGYAMSQLYRIKNHRRWLLNPPKKKPGKADFKNNQEYQAAMRHWKQYQCWDRNRNPSRKKLEAAFGYDTKHAMHLIRLLRMGHELMTKGVLLVKRSDAQELLDIRHGLWTYDEVIKHAEELKSSSDKVFQERTYSIPHKPDYNKLSALCAQLHIDFWEDAK